MKTLVVSRFWEFVKIGVFTRPKSDISKNIAIFGVSAGCNPCCHRIIRGTQDGNDTPGVPAPYYRIYTMPMCLKIGGLGGLREYQ